MGLAVGNLEVVLGIVCQTLNKLIAVLFLVHGQLFARDDVGPFEISLGALILPVLIVLELIRSTVDDLFAVSGGFGLGLDRAAVPSLLDLGITALSSLGSGHLQAESVLKQSCTRYVNLISNIELGLTVPLNNPVIIPLQVSVKIQLGLDAFVSNHVAVRGFLVGAAITVTTCVGGRAVVVVGVSKNAGGKKSGCKGFEHLNF